MASQLFVGFFSEGPTDIRFLEPIIERAFSDIIFSSSRREVEVRIFPVVIDKSGKNFREQVFLASEQGYDEYGIDVLCVHADADNGDSDAILRNKILPAIEYLESRSSQFSEHTVLPIIPVHEIEAWMLADKELLREQLGTNQSDSDLMLTQRPESIARPKEAIENAIRIVASIRTRRRRGDISIADLYPLFGQKIERSKLLGLSSYVKFETSIMDVLKFKGIIT